MTRKTKLIINICVVLLSIMIVVLATQRSSTTDQASTSTLYTLEQVAGADGKDGRPCYVIISNTIYEIKQSGKWQDGDHVPSDGLVQCGIDATEYIAQSPHGKSILSILPVVGRLE